VIIKWDPGAVREAALADLQTNAEIAGKFVETEARRRFDAITTPDNWKAVNYRRFLSKWLLTHTVETTAKEVVIRVGMRRRPEKGGDHHGFYIEIGSRKAPAHPYLRPAVFDNGDLIVALLSGE